MVARLLAVVACATQAAGLLHAPASLRSPTAHRGAMFPSMVATSLDKESAPLEGELSNLLSGMNGKALRVTQDMIPTKKDIRDVVPKHCFTRDTMKSMFYAIQSTAVTLACFAVGRMIPMKAAFLPAWLAYAAVTGTAATGMWVVAHECGHGAFSDNRLIQDTVGYILHTALLVPYFSWQHSHAVHHSRTNHITEGETHVPIVVDGKPGIENEGGEGALKIAKSMGDRAHGIYQLVTVRPSSPHPTLGSHARSGRRFAPPSSGRFTLAATSESAPAAWPSSPHRSAPAGARLAQHLVFGWPVYLLFGATGGPKYGVSNHFWAKKPFNVALWPNKWPIKVRECRGDTRAPAPLPPPPSSPAAGLAATTPTTPPPLIPTTYHSTTPPPLIPTTYHSTIPPPLIPTTPPPLIPTTYHSTPLLQVGQSALGCSGTLALLALWAGKTSAMTVFALYGAPLMFTNMWLVLYTWLQHTDVDVVRDAQ